MQSERPPGPGGARGRRRLTVALARLRVERNGRRVLEDVTWSVRPGQRWVLLGANGAGKTQLLKLLAGTVWPVPRSGSRRRYRWRGQIFDTPEGVREEIAYLGPERQDRYQRHGWNHTVEAVVWTGRARTDIPLGGPDAPARREITRLLVRLGLTGVATRRFLTLSQGERRVVLLARALASRPQLLLLDEPFDGLDAPRREQFLRWLERSAASAMPWVLATHRAEDVPRAATHLLVLEHGRVSYRGPLRRRRLARWFAAAQDHAPPAHVHRAGLRDVSTREPLVRLCKARVYHDGHPALAGIELAIRPGDCWIVHGANGAGKTTFLRTLYGDYGVAHGGVLERHGVEPGTPLADFQRRVGLVAPHLHADQPRAQSVLETVVSGRHASIGLERRASRAELARGRRTLALFGIAGLARHAVGDLSYGQLRRVLFARAWMSRPRLLLLDEPFAGLDPATRRVLQERLGRLVARGLAVVLATHERADWLGCATHELELVRGRPRYCGKLRRPRGDASGGHCAHTARATARKPARRGSSARRRLPPRDRPAPASS